MGQSVLARITEHSLATHYVRAIHSLLFYIFLFFSTFYLGLSAVAVFLITRKTDKAHLCGRLWGSVNLWAAGVTVELKGLENINPKHPYIYAANHQSVFDIFAVLGKLPVQFRWLAKEELFRIPILGQAMSAIGYIPIDRSDRRKAFQSLNQAALQVKNGTSIVIFPEGTRSLDGVLQNFKKGGFVLAIQSQQPIVPISISGSHQILSKHGEWMIHPGTIQMTIGTPIPTANCTIKERQGLIATVREAIRKHLKQAEGGVLPDGTIDPPYIS